MNNTADNYQEDIVNNPFFKAIKRSKLYSLVEKNGWYVCVPQSSAAAGCKITQDVLESHILQASPYFQGEYNTLNKKTVNIEGNIMKITHDSGEFRKAKILFEEKFYNKEDKYFKVLCISVPLVGDIKINGITKLPPTRNLQECIHFLFSSPVNRVVLGKINEQISEFNKSYVIVKGFEQHLVDKVKAMCTKVLEGLACANPDFRELYGNDTMLDELSLVVENYVLASLHSKLFSSLCNLYADDDAQLFETMVSWQNVKATDLGLRPNLVPFAAAAIPSLQRIETCINDALISATATATSPTRISPPVSEPLTISADDTFPLLLYALVRAHPKQLHSNLFYMEHFIFANISTSPLGYHLANLQAAAQFISAGQLNPNQGFPNNNRYEHVMEANMPDIAQNHKRTYSVDDSLPSKDKVSAQMSPFDFTDSSRNRRLSYKVESSNNFDQLSQSLNTTQSRPPPASHNSLKSRSLLNLQTTTPSPQPPLQSYKQPPTVITEKPVGDDQFGDFLLQLKSIDDDTVSKRQFNSIWS